MAEAHAHPELVDVAENPVPQGGTSEWISLEKGKVLLRFASWPAATEAAKGTVILATGRAEFIEKYFEVVRELRDRGLAVAAFDWRGQGGSSRLVSDPTKGHVTNFDLYVDDLQAVVAAAALKGLPRPFYLLAHSMGGTVALMAASHLADQIERMVLTAPMISLANKRASSKWAKGLTGIAGAVGLANRRLQPGGARPPQEIAFDQNVVTSDPRRYARTMAVLNAAPELSIGGPTVKWFNAANRAMRKFEEPGAGAEIAIPTLMVVCGTDKVVSATAAERFAKTLHCGGRVLIPGARHEILMERTAFRTLFWAAFDCFVPGGDLRLPIDIAPPKSAPAIVSRPALENRDAAEPAASDRAEAEPETDGTVALSETPTAPNPEPVVASAQSAPAETPAVEETPTAEPTVARAGAPEGENRRSLFGFFRRKPQAPVAVPAPAPVAETADQPTADATPESESTSEDRTEPTGETAETEQSSAEAALAAAASLVAEATRGETARAPLENTPPASSPDADATPDTPKDAEQSAASAEAPTPSGNGHARIGRLFRRKASNGASETETVETTDTPATEETTSDTAETTETTASAGPETPAPAPSATMDEVKATPAPAASEQTRVETASAEPAPEPVATETPDTKPEADTMVAETAVAPEVAETERAAAPAAAPSETTEAPASDPAPAPDAAAAIDTQSESEADKAEPAPSALPDAPADAPKAADETATEAALAETAKAPEPASDPVSPAPAPAEAEAADEPEANDETDAAVPSQSTLRSRSGGPKPPPRPVKRGRGRKR